MFLNINLQKALLYPFLYLVIRSGRVTKRLCGGLQILIRGFKSLPALLFLLIFFFFILLATKASANLLINEIMFDPIQNDNYNEYIELYNPTKQSINISGWTISDNYAEDEIIADTSQGNNNTSIPPKGYAIITDIGSRAYENFSIENSSLFLTVDDKSIGNGLGNSGDKIILKDNNSNVVDAVEWIKNYSDIFGSPFIDVKEGCSISRHHNVDTNDSSSDFFKAFIPTPGSKNKFYEFGETNIFSENTDFEIKRNQVYNFSIGIKNIGKYNDNISLVSSNVTNGWNVIFQPNNIFLLPNQSINVSILVTPCRNIGCIYGSFSASAYSEKEYNLSDSVSFSFDILAPDLWVKKIVCYNEEKNENNVFYQGENIRIKAFLKNKGNEIAKDVKVCFYYDSIKPSCFIGSKYYETVKNYQKYPSIVFDTIYLSPGFHRFFVIADRENNIEELDEHNNVLSFNFQVIDTSPKKEYKKLIISEFYYHSYPAVFNEFFKMYNPTEIALDLTGYYFTNNPWKNKNDQRKIIFPNNSIIPARSFLTITENASSFNMQTGNFADFEYNYDSEENAPQMNSSSKFFLANKGGILALKNAYNHTIDVFVYGDVEENINGWNGNPIDFSGQGVILKRKSLSDTFLDTNSSVDWESDRNFRIGQSEFKNIIIDFNGTVQTFVSPDNSYNAIVDVISKAEHCIYLNMYEFTSSFLCDRLIDALLRNVSVYLFLEASPVGGISNREKYLLFRLKNYGCNIRFIVNNADEKIFARYSFNHAKYMIVDNSTVVVESCNWADTGVPYDTCFGNREWGVIIHNCDVADYFLDVFYDDWNPKRCDSISFDKMNLSYPQGFYLQNYVKTGFYSPVFQSRIFNTSFSVKPVLSPDTSYQSIIDLINSAQESILVEQLYIYKNWSDGLNPYLAALVNKSRKGVDVKVILNYNPFYDTTVEKLNETRIFLEENNVKVKYIFTNWSYFTNVHNKGVVVDNRSVLISSINWNENSVKNNREAGIIIDNEELATYFASVFYYDWNLSEKKIVKENLTEQEPIDYKNTFYIVVIYSMTFLLVIRDWRKRTWN